MDTPEIITLLLLIIPYGRINSRMTSYLKFRFDRFSFSRRYFPIQPRGAIRHDERGSEEKPNEREERGAYPRSRPSPALLRCRASESEVSGALRDGAKDLARRNFFSTPFQTLTLTRSKISGATGRTNLKIFPSGVFTAA